MTGRKKPKKVTEAIGEHKHKEELKVKTKELNTPSGELFNKTVVDENTTLYLSNDQSFVHFKDNQMGFGGATIIVKLTTGDFEKIIGPYFCTDEEKEKYAKLVDK